MSLVSQFIKLASRRPQRNIPRHNYHESSEESEADESFNSVVSDLNSPVTPHTTPQTSPQPTDQVLADAVANLRVVEAIQAVQPNWPPLDEEEEVIEGHIVQEPDQKVLQEPDMPDIVPFETEDGTDDARALQEACHNLAKLQFNQCDLDFWFNQAEIKMQAVGVKKNYTKFQVLSTIIPEHVTNQVKKLLRKKETDFPEKNAYKKLKDEIIRIFGPKPEEAIDRALGRVLTGKPSELARALAEDICTQDLECSCCPRIVLALWKRQLSSQIRAGIAHCKFNATTFDEVTSLADDIWSSNNVSSVSVAAISAPVATGSLDETQPALPYSVVPEVAALRRGGGRGGNRGGRGNRGGNRGGRGGQASGAGQSSGPSKPKPPKHPDLPPGEWTGCSMHRRWGRGAHFCSEPASCPWKDIFTPRSNNK